MALKRATKSIPLSGGITEEADDYLLEPAGMQYMENLRFSKKDVAEKRWPFEDGVVTGASSYTATPYGIWSEGDTVAVVGNNEVAVSRDAGATFDVETQETDLLGIESILRTASQSGGTNFSWAPVGEYTAGSPDTWNITSYCVAFERVYIDTANTTNERIVVVQVYGLDGNLLEETEFDACGAPKVKPGFNTTWVFMVDLVTGNIHSYGVPGGAGGTNRLGSQVMNYAVSVRDWPAKYNQTDKAYGNVGAVPSWDSVRLGYSKELRINNAAFDMYYDPEQIYGSIAWKDASVAGTIWCRPTGAGGLAGAQTAVLTDVGNYYSTLLDVSNAGLTEVYVLYATTEVTTHVSSLYVAIVNGSTGVLTSTVTVDATIAGQVINGSVRVDGSDAHVAVTQAPGDVTDPQYDTAGNHRVQWYHLNTNGSLVDGSVLYSHRMCSDIAIDKNGYSYYCAQQWNNWNPGAGGTIPHNPDLPGSTPTHKKPVTTVMVSTARGAGNDNQLHATFDAGQSKACLAGEDEQSMHMGGDLYYWNQGTLLEGAHQFWYGNRVLLEASDNFYYISNAAGHATGSDGRVAMHPGAGRFSCYRLQSSIYIPSVQQTQGMFLGTAVPSWYDGSHLLCSMQPVDSPEIVSWTGDGDLGSYMTYNATPLAAEEKVLQAVWGYYDDAGLIHRSAPSTPVYVGNAKNSTTTGNWCQAILTAPVGLVRERKYFVEIYEGWPGGVMQLAATEAVGANNGASVPKVEWAMNLDPMATPKPTDVIDIRASKTLYTAGNVLAADPWPNFDAVVTSGRRLFAHSISDPSAIYYSKTFENGVAPEFSASLVVSVGNENVTALGAIDDKVIVFTDKNCWVLYGTGPDNSGANGDFFLEKMVYQLGCTDQDSIQQFEGGIAFFSSTTQEFHAIGRDLQLVDIGENVKVSSAGITDIHTSIVSPGDHEIRWYCSHTPKSYASQDASPPGPPVAFRENLIPIDPVFVYNYKYQKWSISDTYGNGVAKTTLVNGKVGVVSFSWAFAKEDEVSWDNAELCKWETGWIRVNQLQDFGRFYGATVLGKYLSDWAGAGTDIEAGDLQCTIAYDYENGSGDRDIKLERANVDFVKADGQRLQFKLGPSRQKCQAIKFFFEEKATTAVEVWEPTYITGQGFSLVSVDIHYGAKGGPSRLPAGRNK